MRDFLDWPSHSPTLLQIDLDALAANWQSLRAKVGGATCAAVVKADGYGTGAEAAAVRLAAEGCRVFYVAQGSEAEPLRPLLPADAELLVLGGPLAGGAPMEMLERGIVPVANSLGDVQALAALGRRRGTPVPLTLQVDTGMRRLGLEPRALMQLAETGLPEGVRLHRVLSHLACAEVAEEPFNGTQLQRFGQALQMLGHGTGIVASLANSSGIFLGAAFHGDEVRPGYALYGGNPTPGAVNPMQPVVHLYARVLQVREVKPGQSVGYGATWRATQPTRIATLAIGYADGWLRSGSGEGAVWFDALPAPVIGRVSMDLVTVDVSALPESATVPGSVATVIGPQRPIDSVAAQTHTIGYEVLTGLGRRFFRRYCGLPAR